MAKKFGKFLLGATLVAGAAAAAYWYKKNYLDPKDDDFDDFDLTDDELDDFADYDGIDDFEEEELPRNYVPIKLNAEETEPEQAVAEEAVTLADTDDLDETDDDFADDIDDEDILDEIDDELLDSLAEEALETIQDL